MISNDLVFGGDYLNSDGTGSLCIYGRGFKPEPTIRHDAPGLVTMLPVNGHEIACQFGITTKINP